MPFSFKSRVVITGYINCRDGARISAAAGSKINSAELYALRDISGLPYISGSNFKGLIRKHAESFLQENMGQNTVCNAYDKERACIRLGTPQLGSAIYLRDLIEQARGNEEELKAAIEKHSCLACSLFGSQFIESQLRLDDLRPETWSGQFRLRKNNEEKDAALIERDEESLKAATANNRFVFRAILENCEPWKRALFLVGLSHLQSRLLTISAGRNRGHILGTLEGLELRSLESALELLKCLDDFSTPDGNPVSLEQKQNWINELRLKLSEHERTLVAC